MNLFTYGPGTPNCGGPTDDRGRDGGRAAHHLRPKAIQGCQGYCVLVVNWAGLPVPRVRHGRDGGGRSGRGQHGHTLNRPENENWGFVYSFFRENMK